MLGLAKVPALATAIVAAPLVAISGPPHAAAQTQALQVCMAHVAHDPRFAFKSDTDLSQNTEFADAVQDYCSDEIIDFWDLAHARARTKLGLPEKGLPAIGQQQLAEQEMASIVLAAWPGAIKLRASPPPLSRKRMSAFMLSWLLHASNFQKNIDEKTVYCAVDGLDDAHLTDGDFRKLYAGRIPAGLMPVLKRCGFPAWQVRLESEFSGRFPGSEPQIRKNVVEFFLAQLILQGALTYRRN